MLLRYKDSVKKLKTLDEDKTTRGRNLDPSRNDRVENIPDQEHADYVYA